MLQIVVSDNGPEFKSINYEAFLKELDFKPRTISLFRETGMFG